MSKKTETVETPKKPKHTLSELLNDISVIQDQIRSLQHQQTITVKIKKLSEDAQIPTYVTVGSAGLDIVATRREFDPETECQIYHTDLAIEIPKGYVGLLFPKSNISNRTITLANCVGVIDSDYRGEIMAKFKANFNHNLENIKRGDWLLRFLFRHVYSYKRSYEEKESIVQLIIIPYPKINLLEVEELTPTLRADKGFGEMDLIVN